jgi:hypothetical protein
MRECPIGLLPMALRNVARDAARRIGNLRLQTEVMSEIRPTEKRNDPIRTVEHVPFHIASRLVTDD